MYEGIRDFIKKKHEKFIKWRYEKKFFDIISYSSVMNRMREARMSGLFIDPQLDGEKSFESLRIENGVMSIPQDKLFCLIVRDENVAEKVLMDTYYVFYNNTCIMSQKSGADYIIRVRIHDPNTSWKSVYSVDDFDFFNKELNDFLEIYVWWSVDWFGIGRADSNSAIISGSWNKNVYEDVKKIFSLIHDGTDSSIFDEKYTKFMKVK